MFNVYVTEAGGLPTASKVFAIAEAADILCIIGSTPELGIGTATQAHLAMATRNVRFASDVNGLVYHAEDAINEPLAIADGYKTPPEGPGLGTSLDRDKLAKYRIATPILVLY